MATTKTIDDIISKIETHHKKLLALKELRTKLESQMRAKKGKAERAADTRRKVLVGAVILNAVKLGKISPVFLETLLDQGIGNAADRQFLGLPAKVGEKEVGQSV